jgi:hypothetical protein
VKQLSLWEVFGSVVGPVLAPVRELVRPTPRVVARASPRRKRAALAPGKGPKAELYAQMTRAMLARYGVRVRKWRTSMSGVAWEVMYRDGTRQRLIESPRPRSPMSAAVFLHEIGHHAIGLSVWKPRCLEELKAWEFALEQLQAWGIGVTDRVRTRFDRSMRYAVRKALRRGIRQMPAELLPFMPTSPPPRPGARPGSR